MLVAVGNTVITRSDLPTTSIRVTLIVEETTPNGVANPDQIITGPVALVLQQPVKAISLQAAHA